MVRRISQALALSLVIVGAANAEFSTCRFNFGVDYEKHSTAACGWTGCPTAISKLGIPSNADFLTLFVGYSDDGGPQIAPTAMDKREGQHLSVAKSLGLTPIWYTYIIAFGARQTGKLGDCNDGNYPSDKQLCTKGAQYIRDNRALILSQYKQYAEYAASEWGAESPIIISVEPDFFQYTYSSQQNKLSYSEAKTLLTDITAVIKTALPSAWLAMDISPWADDGWFQSAIPYSAFKFMSTTGGVAEPGGKIKNSDRMTWAGTWGFSQLGMIADDGYGVGGAVESGDANWLNAGTLNSRISEGLIGYWLAKGNDTYNAKIAELRPLLNKLKIPCVQQYKLTMGTATGGKIVTDPVASAFDAGATVKVTAVPDQGYTFSNWTGAKTSKVNPEQLTMSADQTIGAVFTKSIAVLPRKSALPLRIQQTLGGISLRVPVTEGTVQVEVVGMDGTTESVLQTSSVQAGVFEASYALSNLRMGLHVVRVVNGDREFRSTMTVVR